MRTAAAPVTPRPGLAVATRRWWVEHRQQWTAWRIAYLSIVALSLALAVLASPAFYVALVGWLLAGAFAWVVEVTYRTDDRERRLRHATATTPVLAGGYRLRADAGPLEPELGDQVALLAWLHARVVVVTRQVRGHHRGASRRTYRVPLRALARDWARSEGRPIRHGEAVIAELESQGLVRRVRVCQVAAYRLTHATLDDALRALEQSTGRQIVDWALGKAAADQAPDQDVRHDQLTLPPSPA